MDESGLLVPGLTTIPSLLHTSIPTGNESIEDLVHPYWKQWDIENMVPDSWHYAVAAWMTFFGILGTLGNLLVVYTFLRVKSLRTPPNYLIVNLAVSDMSFSAINGFPLLTISAINKKWVWGRTLCQLYGFAGGVFGFISINTLTWIAIDRYYVITQPLNAAQKMTKKRSMMILAIIWAWCLLWALPPFFGWGDYIPEGFQTSCTFDYLSQDAGNIAYNIGIYVGAFTIPVLIIMYSYLGIVSGMMSHHREMRETAKRMGAVTAKTDDDRKTEIQLAKVAGLTITCFLLSWMPYASLGLIGLIYPHEDKVITPLHSEIAVMFAKASAAYNPLIYALSHPKFRAEVYKMFPWLLLCCKPVPTRHSITSKGGLSTSVVSRTDSEVTASETVDMAQMNAPVSSKPSVNPSA